MTHTYDANAILSALMLETTIGARQDGGKTFQLAANRLHESSFIKVLEYGFQRWLNDRVGGKDTTLEDKIADTSIFLAKVEDGTWKIIAKTRDTVDLRTRIARKLVMAKLPKDKRKELAESEKDSVNAFLDAVIAKNAEALAPKIDAEIARLEAEAKEMAGLSLDIEV